VIADRRALHSAQSAEAQVDASSRMQLLRLERRDALMTRSVFSRFRCVFLSDTPAVEESKRMHLALSHENG
jgi:hypothetical protein